MVTKILPLFFIFVYFLPLHSTEMIYQPSQIVYDEEVQIRGFLYPMGQEWVLAFEPNLKSCCLGSGSTKTQIFLDLVFDPSFTHRTVTLKGVLRKERQGAFYVTRLTQGQLVEQKSSYFSALLFILIFVIALCYLYWQRCCLRQ